MDGASTRHRTGSKMTHPTQLRTSLLVCKLFQRFVQEVSAAILQTRSKCSDASKVSKMQAHHDAHMFPRSNPAGCPRKIKGLEI